MQRQRVPSSFLAGAAVLAVAWAASLNAQTPAGRQEALAAPADTAAPAAPADPAAPAAANAAAPAAGAGAAAPAQAPAPPSIQSAWDSLLQNTIPQITPDPTLTVTQTAVKKPRAAGDFLNHFYFETRTDYWRTDTSFTGNPTETGVINAPNTGIFNPAGIPYQDAFQPAANRIYEFMDGGTRGWLSDRINTHFSIRYEQDLTHVDPGAPAQNVLETFNSNRLIEVLGASVDILGKPTDGLFANSTLTVGRQYIYGAETASLDGFSFTKNWHTFTLNLFGGRRFTYYIDPVQRAIGGGGLTWRPDPNTSLSYEALVYVRASQLFSAVHRFNQSWQISGYYRMFGGAPVQVSSQVYYQPKDGNSYVRFSFLAQVTDKDYSFDYTELARSQDPFTAQLRLYLGPLKPFTQYIIDSRRTFGQHLRLGGTIWLRRLVNYQDQSAFQTSFQDYLASAQVFPGRKWEMDFSYNQHNSDRLPPNGSAPFGDVMTAGETGVTDLTGELRRDFFEGHLDLSGGVYYRRVSTQDNYVIVDGSHQSGWLGSAWWRLDQRTRLFFDYALDHDLLVFQPSIADARVLRVGLGWKY